MVISKQQTVVVFPKERDPIDRSKHFHSFTGLKFPIPSWLCYEAVVWTISQSNRAMSILGTHWLAGSGGLASRYTPYSGPIGQVMRVFRHNLRSTEQAAKGYRRRGDSLCVSVSLSLSFSTRLPLSATADNAIWLFYRCRRGSIAYDELIICRPTLPIQREVDCTQIKLFYPINYSISRKRQNSFNGWSIGLGNVLVLLIRTWWMQTSAVRSPYAVLCSGRLKEEYVRTFQLLGIGSRFKT